MKNQLPKVISKNLLYLAIVVFLAITILPSMYFYFKGQQALKQAENVKSNSGETELKKVLAEVSKLVLLPDETPTLATITDKTKLGDQPFYQQSQNGDKVLIYAAAKKAYLYRPSINKIIEIAPVSVAKTASPSAK